MAETVCHPPLICEICGICGFKFGIGFSRQASDIVDAKPVFRVLCSQHLAPQYNKWPKQATFRTRKTLIEEIYSAPSSRARSERRSNGTISFYIARSPAWCSRRNSFQTPIPWSEHSKRS